MLQHAPPPVAVNPEEAKAVFDLWVKRRQEMESRQQMPTTSDLAEAMGIPEEEVFRLLRDVRANPVFVEPAPTINKGHRRRVRFLVFMTILAGLSVVFMLGAASRGDRLIYAPVPYEQAYDVVPSSNDLPMGLSATFRDYKVTGSTRGLSDPNQIERALLARLRTVVEQQTPSPLSQLPSTLVEPEAIMRSVLQDKPVAGTENVLAFEPIQLQMGDKIGQVMMPIALTSDPQLEHILRPEVERRLRVAANKGARLFLQNQAKGPATPTPPPAERP